MEQVAPQPGAVGAHGERWGLLDAVQTLIAHWRPLVAVPLLTGALALAASFLIPPMYTAATVFLPPPQHQSSLSGAVAQLGALSGLMGVGNSTRNSPDQYVALMQSNTVVDRMIDRFGLGERYEEKLRSDTRKELLKRTVLMAGKKDGLITIAVDDEDPRKAAEMANGYVEELQLLTNRLALSEAQQRRVFFESQLKSTRDRLTQAQVALQGSGFTTGALRAEPKAAAEGYARLRAEATAAEVRLSTLRNSLAEGTPEVQSQRAALAALRSQLSRLEANDSGTSGADADYIGKYREFKYQETLFELFSRQYEMARLDEAREGALVQVVDMAQVPDQKSRPKRVTLALAAAFVALVVTVAGLLARDFRRRLHEASGRPAHVGL